MVLTFFKWLEKVKRRILFLQQVKKAWKSNSAFINKILLEHSHIHSFTYCLWLAAFTLQQRNYDWRYIYPPRPKILSGHLQKHLLTLVVTDENFSPLFSRYLASNAFTLDIHISFSLGGKTASLSSKKKVFFLSSSKKLKKWLQMEDIWLA